MQTILKTIGTFLFQSKQQVLQRSVCFLVDKFYVDIEDEIKKLEKYRVKHLKTRLAGTRAAGWERLRFQIQRGCRSSITGCVWRALERHIHENIAHQAHEYVFDI